jgi:hypothetical protein
MRTLLLLALTLLLESSVFSQGIDTDAKLKELALPNSPAFILADVSPTLIQTPNTPKAFVLSLAQTFQQTSGFPQNYSAEFSPYWWINPSKRNIYSLVGLKTSFDASGKNVDRIIGENPFSGLKFTSLSIAFLNKDLIPDSSKVQQKVFSFGIRTTLIKIHQKGYADKIEKKITAWHDKAQKELAVLQEEMATATPEKRRELSERAVNYRPQGTSNVLKEINDLVNQKPIFSWDFAGAYATYGINDSTWNYGRSGIWTSISTFLPLDLGEPSNSKKSYFNLNFLLRYLVDNYQKNEKGLIGRNSSVDIGFKAALDFSFLSIGIESINRYNNGAADIQNRTVGIINYKISDTISLNGAFGRNFDFPDKLVALFGINWGFGSETIKLPKTN